MNQDKIKNVAEMIRQADAVLVGVGDMTPSVIKLPFLDMTYNFLDIFLITVSLDTGSSPEHLNGKCLTLNEDLSYFFQKLRRQIR